jgi:hypothetical protein
MANVVVTDAVDASEKAKKARCEQAFKHFSRIAARNGLTASEVALVAAQFIGVTVSAIPEAALHEPTMTVAEHAMRNAYAHRFIRQQV